MLSFLDFLEYVTKICGTWTQALPDHLTNESRLQF